MSPRKPREPYKPMMREPEGIDAVSDTPSMPDPLDTLRAEVQKFIEWADGLPDDNPMCGHWRAVSDDCAPGLCDAASHDLAFFLRYRQWASVGVRWGTLGETDWCDIYWSDEGYFEGDHCVCTVRLTKYETWAIDLTARQFDPTLPFPMFFCIETHHDRVDDYFKWIAFGPSGEGVEREVE